MDLLEKLLSTTGVSGSEEKVRKLIETASMKAHGDRLKEARNNIPKENETDKRKKEG